MKTLLIEDHPALRADMKALLNRNGFQCEEAQSAESAWADHAIASFELFIVDLNLPGEDGLSFVRRARVNRPGAGFIIISGVADVHRRADGYRDGADLFLMKPVDQDELLSAVQAIARRIRESSPRAGARLDRVKMCLFGPNGKAALTPEETSLIISFCNSPNQSLTRDDVRKTLSIAAESDNSGVIEVRLTKLRKKLLLAGLQQPVIRSMRNRGYVLCEEVRIE